MFLTDLTQKITGLAEQSRTTGSVIRTPEGVVITLGDGPRTLRAIVTPRALKKKYFAQTRSFSVAYVSNTQTISSSHAELMQHIFQIIKDLEATLTKKSFSSIFPKRSMRAKNVPTAPNPFIGKSTSIKISTSCNAGCAFCSEKEELARAQRRSLARTEVFKLIDTAYAQGFRGISFDGGEPTLCPSLPQAIAYARKKGFQSISIVTNGIRLADKAYVQDLITQGLTAMCFSLHAADKKTSIAIYGRNVLPQQIKALKNISTTSRDLPLTIQTVLNTQNQRSLSSILELGHRFNPTLQIIINCLLDLEVSKARLQLLPNIHNGVFNGQLNAFKKKNPHAVLLLRGFPLCTVPGEYWPYMQQSVSDNQLLRIRRSSPWSEFYQPKTNRTICRTCSIKGICTFPLKHYLGIYHITQRYFHPISKDQHRKLTTSLRNKPVKFR